MASPNAPILNKILNELQGFKKEMYEFKTEMYEFRDDFYEFKEDMEKFKREMVGFKENMEIFKNEMYEFRDNAVYDKKYMSICQERSDAEYFRNYMERYHGSLTIERWPFAEFYDKNGKIVTDIDGCITANTIPVQPVIAPGFKNNSQQIKNTRNAIFFIESKNSLDKVNFDVKIYHYNKILSVLKNSKTANSNNTAVSDDYKKMVDSYPLKYKPNEIYFILAATDISLQMRLFIQSINDKSLTEDLYKQYICKMFMENSNYKRIRRDINTKPTLLKKYDAVKTYDGFIEIFKEISKELSKEKTKSLSQKNLKETPPSFDKWENYLNSFFIKYDEVKDLYSNVEGLLGYIYHGSVYMPNPFRIYGQNTLM
jgi:hypothetical protein